MVTIPYPLFAALLVLLVLLLWCVVSLLVANERRRRRSVRLQYRVDEIRQRRNQQEQDPAAAA